MRDEIVALDLELTELDPETGSIIEIGAARFRDGEVIDQYATLVDPGVPIPPRITGLTGISDDDVMGKPRIHSVLPELQSFIGDLPILGHSISTDVGFLQPYGVAVRNSLIDTYELAAFLVPTAPRYSLTGLVEHLGLEDLHAHRALDDTIATCHLYWALWQLILKLPFATLSELVSAAEFLDWDAKLPLVEALRIRSKTAFQDGETSTHMKLPFAPVSDREWRPMRANRDLKFLDVDEMAGLIQPDGRLARHIPGYESREPQIQMLRGVTEAFNAGQHLLIEAPTGTGKSIAYLLPAIYWAKTNKARVVISTATIALQDQLIKKDIPLLKNALGLDFEAAVVKGRVNYLCPRRLEALRRRKPSNLDELRVLAKVLVWLLESSSGDKGEITLRGYSEEVAWSRLSAQDEGCTLSRCESQMEGACPFYKARRKAEASHVLVANHALLLSDVQMENRVLPDYRYLVIDEGHHLEDATTNGLMSRIDQRSLRRRFTNLGNEEKGLFGELLQSLNGNIPDKYYDRVAEFVRSIAQAVREMDQHVSNYFSALMDYLEQSGEMQRGEYSSQVRIKEDSREHPAWNGLTPHWQQLHDYMTVVADAMSKVARALADLEYQDIPNYDDHMNSLQAASRYLQEAFQQLEAFTERPEPNMIYWCDVNPARTHLSINAAPLHVGPLIAQHIWEAKESVLVTSATLATANSFDYVRERLNATPEYVDDLTVDTPFDYENSTLIYIPTDIPEPNQRQVYQASVERCIIEVATATDGRLLGLFTSYAQLRQTAQNITPRLALGGISVLDQASGSSRQLLIDSFKTTEKAVLLGTRSFWEGVDLPGDDLQILVIARLPFTVPSDPVFAARSETFENSFLQYAVPDAILRFRQGFGRLIRRRSDRGVVTILDKRVISKRYGRAFLDSLPNCTVQHGPLSRLPQLARQWIDHAE